MSRRTRHRAPRFDLRAAVAGLALGALSAPGAMADEWSTSVRAISAPPPPTQTPLVDRASPSQPFASPPTRSSVRLSAEDAPLGGGSFYAARKRLAKGADRGPYLGAGLDTGPDGDEAAGALLGGVAAPFLDEAEVFGEMQQVQRANGEEERRFWLGLRTGF